LSRSQTDWSFLAVLPGKRQEQVFPADVFRPVFWDLYVQKTKAMFKLLFRLLFTLLVGVLVYNYFFGTPDEKETSRVIFHDVKQVSKSAWTLLKSEKAKLDAGKYDTALDKINLVIGQLKTRARDDRNQPALSRLEELDRDRQVLERRLETLNQARRVAEQSGALRSKMAVEQDEKRLKSDLNILFDETETLLKSLDQ